MSIATLCALDSIISPTQTCFNPAHTSTPKGSYNACCHYRCKAITSCQVLISGRVNQLLHEGIAAPVHQTREYSVTSPTL